ncbi:shikimate kinase [Allosphingosinicella flava]|uniref:Shikimate kinase n=1 Tax=Allosphingosinicella flava TaxID=2771430 RepID=A0A7T2GLB3_9SPHN|nr:shikimate kinase [Sphingosinicella flava]QPQ55964.1 shikimate kinase [Sphingosinicella flava]
MARPISSFDRSIVLVGLMGAGKSTVGRRLARRLKMPFVDSDHEIETAASRSIAEIFEQYGEESFRDGERRVIARLIEGPPKVIATGGGAFMNERTRRLILSRCIAVWLDAEPEILAERVSRRDTRPLLRDKEALPFLRDLAEIRNPIYAEAHIHIRTLPSPHDRAVADILKALSALRSAA